MYQKTTLDNGLRVITATMPHTQAVSLNLFIGVGSRYEAGAEAGISHFIEHLLFKGTAKRPTAREIAGAIDIDGPKELIISNCAAILEEIDLVRLHQVDGKAAVSLPPTPKERRDLQESQRYAAGDRIRNEWAEFSNFILKRTAEDIHRMLLEMIS